MLTALSIVALVQIAITMGLSLAPALELPGKHPGSTISGLVGEVDGVARCAVEAAGNFAADAFGRYPPHDVAETGGIDVADHIDRQAADLMPLDDTGEHADLGFGM